MSNIRRTTIALLLIALLGVACGSSVEDEAGTTTDDSPEGSDSADTGGSSTGDESDEVDGEDGDSGGETTEETSDDPGQPEDADEPAPEEPVELTATDTGVSETTIKIAAVFPDTTVLGREPGDIEAKYQVAIDAINDAGGINGRSLEMVFSLYMPIGDVESDALCVKNVEDEEVFAVVGILLRTTPLCYTQLSDTITVNTFAMPADLYEHSSAPLIGANQLSTRAVEANLDTLMDAGYLSADMRVAVHGIGTQEDLHQAYLDGLDARGINVVAQTIRTIDNDIAAAEREVDVLAEIWIAENADVVLGSAPESAIDLSGVYHRRGLELPMLLPENSSVTLDLIAETFGTDLSVFEFAVALLRGADDATLYATGQAGVAECVDRFQAATGEVVDVELSDDEGLDNLAPTVAACQAMDIFAAVAESAGPELTTESFAAAAQGLGSFEVTGLLAASLGPDKFDVSDDPAQIARYDAEAVAFVAE